MTKGTRMTIKDGPLTDRQTNIIEHILDGKRHKEIARVVTYTSQRTDDPVQVTGAYLGVIRQEVTTITRKMGAQTSTQAIARYATAQTYAEAAEALLAARHRVPADQSEAHVNHVLEGLAALFEDRARALLPE